MIGHSSTPGNLHSMVYGMRSSIDDVLEWAYTCHLEKLMLESESYVRIRACLGMRLLICIDSFNHICSILQVERYRRIVRDGLKDAIWSDEDVYLEMDLN